ncbi:unnamed protein product [Aphanomyces euteiches]|nr:hypothetical protein AeRB84_017251 [Aphanomyces euteiches]
MKGKGVSKDQESSPLDEKSQAIQIDKIVRPIGNKRAKLNEANNAYRQSQLDVDRKLVYAAEEKNRIMKDDLAMRLFSMDPDCEESKQYFMIKRKQYLAALHNDVKDLVDSADV